jgi:hypothetical protein
MNEWMKKYVAGIVLLSTVAIGREIRTPLPLAQGPAHYPVMRDVERDNKVDCYQLDIDIWNGYYHRSANDAYGNCCDETPCSSSSWNVKIPLSALYFNQADFVLADAFANSTVSDASDLNPWLSISTLKPRLDYQENGTHFGVTVGTHSPCTCWSYGLRARIPYRDIDVEQECASDMVGDQLDDVFFTREEQIPSGASPSANVSNTAYAVRLDLLNQLQMISYGITGQPTPLAIFTPPVTIAAQIIAVPSSPTNSVNGFPVAAVISAPNATVVKTTRWSDIPDNITATLTSVGGGVGTLARGQFDPATDYTALSQDQVALSQLYLVETLRNNPTDPATDRKPSLLATGVFNAISTAVNSLGSSSVQDFFDKNNIDTCNTRHKGFGDLDTELYASYNIGKKGWVEARFGVVFPTGKKIENPLVIFKQPTGNNGHYEVRFGAAGGYDINCHNKVKADAAYSFVLQKTENICAPFLGATIKNIGPSIPAQVSWQYFVGHLDWTSVHPKNASLGFDLGYELYWKHKDNLCFCGTGMAEDFNGNLQYLDASVERERTNVLSNKIRSELFYDGNCFNIFGGMTWIIAGHNVPRETDMYAGISVLY